MKSLVPYVTTLVRYGAAISGVRLLDRGQELEEVIGALLVVGAVVWSMIEKRLKRQQGGERKNEMAKNENSGKPVPEREVMVPLGVVVTVVASFLGGAVWGVRTLDGIARDISAIRAQVSIAWTVHHQEAWAAEFRARNGTNTVAPDPLQIWQKINAIK